MAEVVSFNMIVEINQLLKDNNIEYSIHAVGGCSCCGLELRQDGSIYSIEKIIQIINEYLSSKWMKVNQSYDNPNLLYVESKFNYEK